ncbi:MAG: ABC superfamily ATP binding cassette transporter protein [Parcubacteria group bacterium GW2011_GWA2_47_7]|nr:MAG: ABC superfamily ATP binding cassette transporter protein [Parcubacteria group bacterium GW2011_GWA2_47_7]
MRLQDIAMLSTRAFKTNPARTWLTIAGMGVGTGAVVTLVGLGFGLQNIILEQIVFGETLLSLSVNNPPSKAVQLTDRSVSEFEVLPNVKDVSPLASFPALITIDGLSGNAFLQGAEPAFFRYSGATAVSGDLFLDGNEAKDQDGVILTKAVLKLFAIEKPEDALGKMVTFRVFILKEGTDESEQIAVDKAYKVMGVTNEENFIAAIIPLTELQNHMQVKTYDKVQVRITKSDFLDPTQVEIVKKGYVVTALSKTVEQANKIFQGIQAVLAVFGGIALTVSAIGMFNTMTVTLLERTAEIGIMRTLGASSGDIQILFVAEAVIVGFLGGIMGIAFGGTIGFVLNSIMNVAASNFGGKSVSLFSFPLTFLTFIAVFSAIVGFLTGVFPAKRAAGLNPLDAIRYK